MAVFEIKMPKLGESVEEALIAKWFIKAGDLVKEDDVLVSIASDKVDSEVPSPVAGKVIELKYGEYEKVAVGTVIALIETGESVTSLQNEIPKAGSAAEKQEAAVRRPEQDIKSEEPRSFLTPVAKKISKENNVSADEINSIEGTGSGGRVTKDDLLSYIGNRNKTAKSVNDILSPKIQPVTSAVEDEIIEMDRVRKMIAEHMILSKNVSAHVTNFVEADVTELVQWREKNRDEMEKRFRTKLTFMPFFVIAAVRAIRDFPLINASVDGTRIIIHKNINIGIAVALPSGNLIVPVIRNADRYNTGGLAVIINELAEKARNNKLSPDDISGGTFTLTNFGTFKNTAGTPIINQPQAAILGMGMIQKKPAVIESPLGDMIAVRQQIVLSLSYDHRIIDGSLGGAFLRRVADYLEKFDTRINN